MSPSLSAATTACLLLAAGTTAFATPAPKKPGFDAYALLRTRNIFDPERQPGATTDATPAASTQAPPGRADFAALTGIMITSEKPLAFFSGSRPEYSGVLPAGSAIAGARLARITADAIEIERNGKRTLVAVGQTVPLDATSAPTAAPTPIAAPDPSASSAAPTGAATFPSSPAASTPASADREALIRRMMEKRQKELQ
ncbi:MAG: hypothetical protein WCH57_10595 [Verrucomicrobiota bacterium]